MKLSKINTGQRSRWLIKATCIDRSHYPYRALFHGCRHEAKCLFYFDLHYYHKLYFKEKPFNSQAKMARTATNRQK